MIISLNSPWFELVQSGTKKYEGRRCTSKMMDLKVGNIIDVKHHTEKNKAPYQIKVLDILLFPTFETALNSLPIEEVLPIPYIDVQKGVEIYKQYVSIATQLKDGIMMFKVEPI